MISYCIIDDEPIAHRIIEDYCKDLSHLQKVGNAYNAFEATKILSGQPVDLVFLDINMPKMTGFEWLKTLKQRPQIIVTTAYQEYALEGYELDVVDYLLKPFSLTRFLQAINKVHTQQQLNPPSNFPASNLNERSRIFLKGDKKYHQLHVSNILFVEAYGNYSKVYLADEMILSHEKISTLENLLSSDQFMRVHKSYIVAVDKIKLVEGNMIHLQDQQIPIGQTYRSRVNKLLKGE